MIVVKYRIAEYKKSGQRRFSGITLKELTSILLIVLSAFTSGTSLAQKNLQPGQTFRDCPNCPEMVVIPAGSFMIGSPGNEPGRSSNEEWAIEGPQRLVHIHEFAAGKFDITKAQWAAFVKATNRKTAGGCSWAMLPGDTSKNKWDSNPAASWNHVGFYQDSSHPVVCVTWNDTQDYVNWLSKETGAHYRLLTEAEWEYAARAGTTTPFPWGITASHEYANYGSDTINGVGFASGRDKWDYATSPVGSFPPNPFGLYDMHGNVMQWVEDCFSMSYNDLPTDGSANKKNIPFKLTGNLAWLNEKSPCAFRIVRGGCFADSPAMIRSASRNMGALPGTLVPDYCTSAGGGFRVAKTL